MREHDSLNERLHADRSNAEPPPPGMEDSYKDVVGMVWDLVIKPVLLVGGLAMVAKMAEILSSWNISPV